MKKIKFIYATMLLVLALATNACDDYYSVTVNGDPGITPTVLITPEHYFAGQRSSRRNRDYIQHG